MNFIAHIKRAAAALRKSAADKPKAPAPTLKAKMLAAVGVEPKPFRILVPGPDGSFVSKPATAAEALEYANHESAWKRIA